MIELEEKKKGERGDDNVTPLELKVRVEEVAEEVELLVLR